MKFACISVKLVLLPTWLKTTMYMYVVSHVMPHLIDLAYQLMQSQNQIKTKNHQQFLTKNVNIRALMDQLGGLLILSSCPIQTTPCRATLMPHFMPFITSTLRLTMDSPFLPKHWYPFIPTCPFLIEQKQKHTWTLFLLLLVTTTI